MSSHKPSPSKSKLTWKTAFIGAVGLGVMSYAALRKPRWVYDGAVVKCEGSSGNAGIDCRTVTYQAAGASGELYAPVCGTVTMVQQVSATSMTIRVASDNEPLIFTFYCTNGSTPVRTGQYVKQGDVIARSQGVALMIERLNPTTNKAEVVSPSAWLAVNGLTHVKNPGGLWCESQKALAVPNCGNDNFASPRLPRWSLKNIQLSMG